MSDFPQPDTPAPFPLPDSLPEPEPVAPWEPEPEPEPEPAEAGPERPAEPSANEARYGWVEPAWLREALIGILSRVDKLEG